MRQPRFLLPRSRYHQNKLLHCSIYRKTIVWSITWLKFWLSIFFRIACDFNVFPCRVRWNRRPEPLFRPPMTWLYWQRASTIFSFVSFQVAERMKFGMLCTWRGSEELLHVRRVLLMKYERLNVHLREQCLSACNLVYGAWNRAWLPDFVGESGG